MSYYSEVTADSPLYWWKMNNTSGNDTDVIASKVLTAGGGVSVNQPGNALWAGVAPSWSFAGSTAGAITTLNAITAGTNHVLTVEFLANFSASQVSDALSYEFTNNSNGNNGARMTIKRAGAATIGVGMTTSSTIWEDTCANTLLLGGWHHVAVVHDRNTPANKLYIDGAAVTLTSATHTLAASTDWAGGALPFNVGCRNSTTLLAAGNIDEFAIYASELSSGRVAAHYAQLAGRAPGWADTTVTA